MAQINEAYRVLSDPARRAVYDASRRAAGRFTTNGPPTAWAAASTVTTARRPRVAPPPPPAAAARRSPVPWRFMLALATLGIAFVIVNAAFTKPSEPVPPDNLLGSGSCVAIEPNGDAREVTCDGTNDGVVAELIDEDGICPSGSEPHRDRQGMGVACVRMAGAATSG